MVESQNKTTRPKEKKNTRKRQSVKQNELETDSSDPSDDTFFIGQLGQLAGSQLVVTSGILVILSWTAGEQWTLNYYWIGTKIYQSVN